MNRLFKFLPTRNTNNAPPPMVGRSPAYMVVNGQVLDADDYLRSDYVRATLSGQSYYASLGQYGLDDETLAQLFTVGLTAFVCVRTRSRLVSGLPLIVNTGGLKNNHTPAHDFINNASELLYQIESSMSIWGKCYLYKRRNFANLPLILDWVSPLDVRPVIHMEQITGYQMVGVGHIPLEDMIYIKEFNPLSSIDGLSPYEVAFKSIRTEANIIQHAMSFFLNGARPDLLIKAPAHISPEDIERYVKQWKANFQGSDKAYRVAMLPSGEWTVEPLNSNPVDLAMPELDNTVTRKTIAAFGLNPIIVGLGDAGDPLSAINTYDVAWENAVQYLAVPEMEMILVQINEWLEEFDGIYGSRLKIEIDLDQINATSKDNEARANTAIATQTSGIRSVNESREYVGLKADSALIPRSRDFVMEYNTGLIKRAEARRHMGLPAEAGDDGYIYEIDPRQSGPTMSFGSPFGATVTPFPLPQLPQFTQLPQLPAPSRKQSLQVKRAKESITQLIATRREIPAVVGVSEPTPIENPASPPANEEIEPPILIEVDTFGAQRNELRQWRQKQRNENKEARRKHKPSQIATFEASRLPEELQVVIRAGLTSGLSYELVFDCAESHLRNGNVPDAPFGITPEEYTAYWRDLDDMQADISHEWLVYMAQASHALIESAKDNPELLLNTEDVFGQYREDLLQAWVGTPDQPGALTQSILAGMAKGNAILNEVAKPGSPIKRSEHADSVMIALTPSPEMSLAIYGALGGWHDLQAPDSLHLTLAYLGDKSALEAQGITPQKLGELLGSQFQQGIKAKISGLARFNTDEDYDPLVLLVDSQPVHDLHAGIVTALADAQVEYTTTHAFNPHVTVLYAHPSETVELTFPRADIIFNEMVVAWGDEWISIHPSAPVVRAKRDEWSKDAYAFARQYGLDLIRGIDDTTRQRIAELFQKYLDEGWTRDQLEAELAKVLVVSPNQVNEQVLNRAKLISNTELARAYNSGANKRWQDVGVRKAIWQTVRDSMTCPICREVHGQEYTIGEGVYSRKAGKYLRAIAHPGCRCFSRPKIEDLDYAGLAKGIING